MEQMHRAVIDVPGQGFRSVVDARKQGVEGSVDGFRLFCLESVQRFRGPAEIAWLPAIDLAAAGGALVDHNWPQAGFHQPRGGAPSGRAGSDNYDSGLGHAVPRVRMRMPWVTGVEQACNRAPSVVQTQQS